MWWYETCRCWRCPLLSARPGCVEGKEFSFLQLIRLRGLCSLESLVFSLAAVNRSWPYLSTVFSFIQVIRLKQKLHVYSSRTGDFSKLFPFYIRQFERIETGSCQFSSELKKQFSDRNQLHLQNLSGSRAPTQKTATNNSNFNMIYKSDQIRFSIAL